MEDVIDLDIAVIGAGVAGAYTAWRLQGELGKEQSIGLFEYSGRVGGRLYSITMPGMPHVRAELGGMRYIPTQHIMVANLVNHLGLETKDFPMGAPPPVGSNCNLFYLRGKHLRLHELSDPAKVPYDLAWSERGLGPTNLQVQVMNNLFPNFANLSLCDQLKVDVFGKPIWKYGFWDLMFKVLSNEGYQFMRDAGGYDANVANASAVTQLPATEYSDDTKYLCLSDGYDHLPKTLVDQFKGRLPGTLPPEKRFYPNHKLKAIDIAGDDKAVQDNGGHRYTLSFERTGTVKAKTTAPDPSAPPRKVRARRIVLALPRRSLELIESPFFEDEWLKTNIPSVLIQSAFKLMMAYERPWWRALGLVAGRSVTDLPIRQVYYMGTECEQKDGLPFLNSLMMGSYNDISTVPFWKGLEGGDRFTGYPPSCLEEGVDQVVPDTEYDATDEMVDVANRQIAAVHALPEIPRPYSAAYHTWNEDPYGGGWHEWKAGYRLDEIMCRMRKPVATEDIHIVGEAYSYDQGWVEGSLTTAESMLNEFFGLKRPQWLKPDHALLPNPCPGCGDLKGCVSCWDPTTLDAMTPNCFQTIQEG